MQLYFIQTPFVNRTTKNGLTDFIGKAVLFILESVALYIARMQDLVRLVAAGLFKILAVQRLDKRCLYKV